METVQLLDRVVDGDYMQELVRKRQLVDFDTFPRVICDSHRDLYSEVL